MLRDRNWCLRYTPDDGDLVRLFYIPALQDAVRYHRLTGYFNAGALALAARGIEGLVRNDGHMRLLVGCTLEAEEIAAIERGEALREQVERRLAQSLAPRAAKRPRTAADNPSAAGDGVPVTAFANESALGRWRCRRPRLLLVECVREMRRGRRRSVLAATCTRRGVRSCLPKGVFTSLERHGDDAG